jgi:hypothetical protein
VGESAAAIFQRSNAGRFAAGDRRQLPEELKTGRA